MEMNHDDEDEDFGSGEALPVDGKIARKRNQSEKSMAIRVTSSSNLQMPLCPRTTWTFDKIPTNKAYVRLDGADEKHIPCH